MESKPTLIKMLTPIRCPVCGDNIKGELAYWIRDLGVTHVTCYTGTTPELPKEEKTSDQ